VVVCVIKDTRPLLKMSDSNRVTEKKGQPIEIGDTVYTPFRGGEARRGKRTTLDLDELRCLV